MATTGLGESAGAARAGEDLGERAEACGATAESTRYVARQPILDIHGNLHGYELLFRAGPTADFTGDGNAATRDVLDNLVTDGMERLTGNALAFVNCTREALLGKLVLVLPPGKTVLELLETLEPTAELLEACRELKTAGFRLALDDFEWRPGWEPFLPLADYVKVDLSITTPASRAELMQRLRGCRAQLLAERVETRDDVEMARREGFTLFQGYYFCKPTLMPSRKIPANHLIQLQILQALQNEPLDMQQVSRLVKREAALTYRLLRMVNSPLYGISRSITSIRGALVLIGDAMFRRIATLAIAGEFKGGHPSELLLILFARARFCELVARHTGQDATEQYLVGILSLLPVLMNATMESVLETMPLRPAVQAALRGEENAERRGLELIWSYEMGNWERSDQIAMAAGIDGAEVPRLYVEAQQWAVENLSLAG